jgi:ADP-heptose:LPS heptosyltransferase
VRLLVNISAGEERRRWPVERFVEAVRHMSGHSVTSHVLIMAAPEDAERAEEIARATGARAVIPKLRDAFALVAAADCLFTPDTSISHAASAFEKPSVVMMIHGMNIFEPYETPGRSVYSEDETLNSLLVAPVISALDELLAEVSAGQRPAATRYGGR